MKNIFTLEWLKAAGIRALKTVAQTAIATIGKSSMMNPQFPLQQSMQKPRVMTMNEMIKSLNSFPVNFIIKLDYI